MEDLTGKQFGPYQIVAPLGEGGMAAVYKAFQPAMERYVALKVLPRHFASDPQFVARFKQEAKVLAQLQHPHILPIFDFGEADSYTYLVMPFVKSGTLTELLKGQPLPFEQIHTIVSQVGSALDYAHSHGYVHRDVKPSNILIDEGGNCLLSDFGLAKMLEGNDKLTASGAIMGTPAYMSPEQGMGKTLDGRSDIYSLGVILYEMATGRPPYKAETPMAVMIKHITDPLPPPTSVNPDLPETIEAVILKALAKNPEDRYQTAGDMVRALQLAIPDSPVSRASTLLHQAPKTETLPSAIPEPELSPTPVTRSKGGVPIWIWGLIGAVILVLVIGGGFWGYNLGLFPFSRPATVTSLPAATPPSEALIATGELRIGQELLSVNKQYSFKFEPDSNLAVYDNPSGRSLWSSNTQGSQADYLVMQNDGNLVLYTKAGSPVWQSQTVSKQGAYFLLMQDDGNLVIKQGELYKGEQVPIWATNTNR